MIRQNFILRDFIRIMKTMTGEGYRKTVMDWFELSCDVCEDTPAQLGNELEDVLRSLLFVKHNFRPEVLQKSLTTLVLPNEVIYGAMLFDNSVDKGGLLLGTIHKQPCDEKRKVMGHEKSNRDDPL